jgi:very-short-patch-repair endonuclease
MRSPDFIRDRAKSLRRTMTQPEQLLWSLLRRGRLGMRFRRQHPIGPYVLDFYCASARLCIEIDGPMHAERDERRTKWLAGEGIRVLRFSPAELEQKLSAVLAAIEQAAPLSTTPSRGPPLP